MWFNKISASCHLPVPTACCRGSSGKAARFIPSWATSFSFATQRITHQRCWQSGERPPCCTSAWPPSTFMASTIPLTDGCGAPIVRQFYRFNTLRRRVEAQTAWRCRKAKTDSRASSSFRLLLQPSSISRCRRRCCCSPAHTLRQISPPVVGHIQHLAPVFNLSPINRVAETAATAQTTLYNRYCAGRLVPPRCLRPSIVRSVLEPAKASQKMAAFCFAGDSERPRPALAASISGKYQKVESAFRQTRLLKSATPAADTLAPSASCLTICLPVNIKQPSFHPGWRY